MKKGIIRDASKRDLTKAGAKHVIIERDSSPINPVTEHSNLFYLHSNVTREFCANESRKGYPGLPVVEILDEDGFGTGEYKPKEDAFMFPVAAYIHGGIALSLGSGSHFPDRQWDVTRNAAWMWTDKKRFCELCGEENWMRVYDDKTKTWRPAKDRAEFERHLRKEAEALLHEWQMWNDGEVYGYRTETSCVPYKRLYPDGHTEDEVDWEDGEDSCWGFITENATDIDFPRGDGWEVFDASGDFVGKEYEIPEFVVTRMAPDGVTRLYLTEYREDKDSVYDAGWMAIKDAAITFPSWWKAQRVAQQVIDRKFYDARKNCVEIGEVA